MSSWIHNPQGRIIAVVREQSRQGPLKSRTSKLGSGVVLVVALGIAVGLIAFWPSDTPALLPVAVDLEAEDRLISGVAGTIDGEEHIFALTTNGDEFAQPALTIFTIDDSGVPHQGASLPAPVDQLHSDLPATPRIALSGDTAFIPLAGADQSVLWIVEFSDPNSPQELSTTELKTRPGAVAVDGNLAAIGPMDGTIIRLFDISDPGRPRALDTYRYATIATADLELVGGTLYISDDGGVEVVDVSSPNSPREISRWESDTWESGEGLPMRPTGVTPRIAIVDDHLFVAADVWGVDILDVSDPSDIDNASRSLSRSQIPQGSADQAVDLVATGDRLYVLWRRDYIGDDPHRWTYTIQEIDVSDPGDPDIVSETDDIGGESTLKSLAIADDYVYFLNGDRIHTVSTSE